MKKDEFNSMIRLCFESVPDDLGDDLWDSTLHWGGDLDEVEEYSGYDEMFLCYKSKFSNLVEENWSFWYVKDNANWYEEVFLQHLDI